MKALVVIESIVLVAVLAVGGWYYSRVNDLSARLSEHSATPSKSAESAADEVVKQRDAAIAEREIAIAQREAALAMARVEITATEAKGMQLAFMTAPAPDGYAALRHDVDELAQLAKTAKEAVAKPAVGSAFPDEWKTRLDAYSTSASRTGASLRESKFAVYADQEWQTSDLAVNEGEHVALASTGMWRWAPSIGHPVGAEGEDATPDYRIVQLPNGALITRVRGEEAMHAGLSGFDASREGKVEFRINDRSVRDNSGSLDATMWAFYPLAW